MAARTAWRFWGPMALVFCGPLVWPGLAAEPTRRAADPESTAVVHCRGDTPHASVPGKGSSQGKEVMARQGGAAKEGAEKPGKEAAGGPTCDELVRAALAAEAAGKTAEREKLLRQALDKDPNYAPARWHLGYVRMGGAWLKWDEVQRRMANDPRMAEYRRLFDEQAGTPAGELALARWCRDKGLEEHARFHWFHVLAFQPQHEEALKALGMHWYKGRLLTHDEIVAARQGQNEPSKGPAGPRVQRKDWAKYFAPRITKWQRMIAEDNAAVDSEIREELQAINKSSKAEFWAALRAIDSILLLRSQWKRDVADYRALSLKWVELLARMPDRPATVSLARHAIDHPMPEVRAAAADGLKKRPMESYVPLLLSRMRAPIEVGTALTMFPEGGGIYAESIYQEGVDADYEAVHSQSVLVGGAGPRLDPPPPPGSRQTDATRAQDARALGEWQAENRAKAAQATVAARAVAVANATATQRRVERVNAAICETNRRVQAALRRATGKDLGELPKPWYAWWQSVCYEYYDVEPPPQNEEPKPLYQWYTYATQCVYFSPRPTTSYSAPSAPAAPSAPHQHAYHPVLNLKDLKTIEWVCCFPRGTTVWSLSGAVPIDRVKAGDRVLSQNPTTGELAFKPVLEVTVRKPSPLMKISLGSETITATRGHPFGVVGEGWKMAKELKPGMRLWSVAGSASVDRVEMVAAAKPWHERLSEAPDARPEDDLSYNLVVDDFHSYFVGQHKVFVFDNLLAAYAFAQSMPGTGW